MAQAALAADLDLVIPQNLEGKAAKPKAKAKAKASRLGTRVSRAQKPTDQDSETAADPPAKAKAKTSRLGARVSRAQKKTDQD